MNNNENLKKSKIEYDEDGNPKISLCRVFKIFRNNINTKIDRIEYDTKTTREYTNTTIDQMIENVENMMKELNLEQKDDNKIKELEKENTELKDKIKELEEAKKENEFYNDFFRKCLQEIIEEEQSKQKEEITVKS
jgi:hypothetical protein